MRPKLRKMTNAQTKQLLENLNLFRRRYYFAGIILTILVRDIDAGVLVIPPNLMKVYSALCVRRFGNQHRKGRLQRELDREMDGILTSVKFDYPYLTQEDISIISYSAAGFPDYLIARFSNLSSPKRVSARRSQLTQLLRNTDRDRREIYLAMLSTAKRAGFLAALPDHQSGRNQDLT